MNEYDSARIADLLVARGAEPVSAPDSADLVVLNTCHIREKAAEKVYSELGRLALLRKGNTRRPLLAVAGCVAQGEGEEILRRAPQVDFVIGPQSFHRLNALLDAELAQADAADWADPDGEQDESRDARKDAVRDGTQDESIDARKDAVRDRAKDAAQDTVRDTVRDGVKESKKQRKINRKASRSRRMALEFPTESKFDFLPEEHLPRGVSAYLAVQEGCDRLCSFCVVPYTRGPEFSRTPEEVLAEADRLFAQGVRELTLLGQNVNAYQAQDAQGQVWDLARLLAALCERTDCLRLRYTTSHPLALSDSLIAAHRDLPKLAPYLHLPVQSGSDRILKAMNRRHTVAHYLERVAALRQARPDIALSSDFIVGFPGETEQDFAQTLALVNQVGFAQAYAFKYSARPGTPAATMADQVPEQVKDQRLAGLLQLLAAQQAAFNRQSQGTVQEVLLVESGKQAGQCKGRSPWMQSVVVDLPEVWLGQMVPLKIVHAAPRSLVGEPVEAHGANHTPDQATNYTTNPAANRAEATAL